MKALNIHETKTHLSSLLVEVEERGETFLICRNGKPVANLVPHRTKSRLMPHPSMSRIEIKYNPTEPLTAEEWPEEEER
jgi:antitoxin (DNA-binding transcriptional repressor) of toxin-antitoxin stability system